MDFSHHPFAIHINPLPRHRQLCIYFLPLEICLFGAYEINIMIGNLWSLENFSEHRFSRAIHDVVRIGISVIFYCQMIFYIWLYNILFTHSSVVQHFNCFHYYELCCYKYFCANVYIPWTRTIVSYGKFVFKT